MIGPLGAGGMGEVYKAQDLTLERTVALKILPPDLVRNEERVRRFMQEAKSASSLNHPNIVTIHEIGQATVDEASLHYIAMELVDGYTLRRKIHEENTDLRTLLQYLAQAADGLAKAHAAGIVHRDLKPENIMVTRDGFAKVLDFGLAKLSVKRSASEGTTEATEARQVTREGAVMGTVAYMSPEQVQGKVVDHRSDIFSFGCILYEAATRKRAFDADSDFDLMHKIVHDKPQPVDEINPNVPTEVRRMIRRCLQKDPDKRYQSMKDIAIELNDIVEEFEQLSISATSASSKSGIAPLPPTHRALSIVTAVLAIALAATGYFLWRRMRVAAAPAVAYQSMKIQKLAAPLQGTAQNVTLSPDGKYLAFSLKDATAKYSLWVRQIATGSDVQIVPPAKMQVPDFSFSPDGNYVYYNKFEGEGGPGYAWLYQIPTLGGTPRKLLFDVDTAPSFSPDGKQIAFGRGDLAKNLNFIIVANADGTAQHVVHSMKRLGALLRPSWSPDGKSFATAKVEVNGGAYVVPIEIDAATGKEQRIGNSRWDWISDIHWLPDRSGLVMMGIDKKGSHGQLWLLSYPAGIPAHITNDLSDYGRLSLSADGNTVATVRYDSSSDLVLYDTARDAEERTLPVGALTQVVSFLTTSRTGATVFQYRDEKGADIAIMDSPETAPRSLTNDGGSFVPVISGDGKRIFFVAQRDGLGHLFTIDPDGSDMRQLTSGKGEGGVSVSDDGSRIIYFTIDAALMRANGDGTGATEVLKRATSAVLSPDGTKIAYTIIVRSGDRDVSRLAIIPATGGKAILDVQMTGGGYLRWKKSSDAVSFVRAVDGIPNIFAQPLNGGPATQVTHFRKGYVNGYDWTADGKLIVSHGDTRSEMILVSDYR